MDTNRMHSTHLSLATQSAKLMNKRTAEEEEE